ncbi:MAG: RecB family exonuclease [Desulfobacterales bacterium]
MVKIEKFDFTPILGWSITRYDTFNTCKRQYFYQYYAKYDSEFKRAKIDALKKLTSIPLEIGNIVHDTISAVLKRLLKSRRRIDQQKFDAFVEEMAETNCESKTFFEVYYKEMTSVEPEDLLPGIKECLKAFLGSSRFEWIKDQAVAGKHDWLIEPPGYGEARINGLKVYCKVDFLFVIDEKIIILDWKTGKRDEKKHRKQLFGYSTWAAHHLKASAPDINAAIAYLRPSYEEVALTPSTEDLKSFNARIGVETKEMNAFCSDVQENIPNDKASFQMIPQSIFCNYCNFKELCDRI